MEAWSLDVLSTAPPLREDDPAAADASAHAVRHFREAGDVSGITLTLDVLSVVALAGGQRRRRVGSGVLRGRSWPSAEPASPRGTRIFALLPSDVRNVRAPELETLAAEGAALCLSETVAYALGEQDPSGDDATSTWGR